MTPIVGITHSSENLFLVCYNASVILFRLPFKHETSFGAVGAKNQVRN